MQHVQQHVPVSALVFWEQDTVLAGEGAVLQAYDVRHRAALTSAPVFKAQAIHGIIANGNTVLVWGGRSICNVTMKWSVDRSLIFRPSEEEDAPDWILDLAFASNSQSHSAVAVTAHNALLLCDVSRADAKIKIQSLISGSNCILYSAQIAWLSHSQCLIASGTAFGDIIVWSCILTQDGGVLSAQRHSHYTFSAHDGSVFGVRISPRATASVTGNQKRILASCSDDRTIRLWDVSDLNLQSPDLAETKRQTGFGAKTEGDQVPMLYAKVMAHVSRIWQVHFLPTTPQITDGTASGLEIDRVYVASFGEDASSILWEVEPNRNTNGEPPYALAQLLTRRPHSGKNIWSVAIGSSKCIATGGGDGVIALLMFDGASLNCPVEVESHILAKTNAPSNFKSYGFVNPGELVATSDSGAVYLLTLSVSGKANTTEILQPVPGLRGYSLLASVPGFAFMAGSDGAVYSYDRHTNDSRQVAHTPGKVAGLFLSTTTDSKMGPLLVLLVTNVGAKQGQCIKFKIGSGQNQILELVQDLPIRLPANFIVTSFAHLEKEGASWIILGSRSGAIQVTNELESGTSQSRTFADIHSREAVTALKLEYFEHELLLLSVGRDGSLAVHDLTNLDAQTSLETVHQLPMPFGPNIEGIHISAQGHLWTWGFRSKQFVVYDVNLQREIMEIVCGGAHRTWAFHPTPEGGTFTWTKASKLYQQTQTLLPIDMLKVGGHGREIKAAAVSMKPLQLVATGAEDTDIKISVHEDENLRCLHTIRKHNTGIQHLQWSVDGRYLFSSGGFEEFFIWKVSAPVPYLEAGVICESAHPRSGSSDLRIMNFDARTCSRDAGAETYFDIVMAYSDSTLKLWRYNNRSWSLLAHGDYLTACLTQCLWNDTGRVLTASTDGHLAFWTWDTERRSLDWSAPIRVHQNGILDMVIERLEDSSLLVMSAGDDNGIGVTRVAGADTFHTLLLTQAHAAAVTSVKVVRHESNQIWLASTGIDQRIKLWHIQVDHGKSGIEGIEVKAVSNDYTAVADASSMEKVTHADGKVGIVICGVGVDLWKF